MSVYDNYSVLMSVYIKEKPEYLRESMLSIYNQTIPTNDFVLVCDGPLTKELDCIIEEMQKLFKSVLHVVRLPVNQGLGIALNKGIQVCKNELVARMDSDDISREDRCERQLEIFNKFSDISLVSGTIEEFFTSIDTVENRRLVPETQEEILQFAKKRNPFNHPCIMYRKSDVLKVGSYQDFYLMEDYYLWVRMLLNGAKGYNIQTPLLWARTGLGMYGRRGGWLYVESQIKFFRYLYTHHFISLHECVCQSMIRVIGSLIPSRMRAIGYKLFLRN